MRKIHFWEELGATLVSANGWSGPKDQKNDMDKSHSVCGLIYVIVNSCKSKSKTLKEHILNKVLPHGCNTKILDIEGECSGMR